MLGDTSLLGSSGHVVVATAVHGGGGGGGEVGGVSSNSGGEEDNKSRVDEGERSFGGNRWPRQETLALLKIRSDMDQVFRDSTLKGPLWQEVSRKLAELGYNRSAKKCKEKFENVYKYHKRTKEGRTGKHEGKNYRFFDQLEAFQNHHSLPSPTLPKPQTPVATTAAMPWTNPPSVSHMTVPSTTNPINVSHNIITTTTATITNPTIPSYLPPNHTQSMNPSHTVPSSFANISTNLFSSSTSSSTASDDEFERRGKRKRKWKEFFKRITKEVMERQEELQKKFLETMEKREHERMVREDAWRIQEMARINREHEILVQERSTAAAKDAAVIAFLQKISGVQAQEISQKPPPPRPHPQPQPQPHLPAAVINLDVSKADNGDNVVASTSSRWPKDEVEALIRLRTTLDVKYQENGPKGPLWEEISVAMRNVGYNRSSKRCKEKWENINKYFKKVKESSKKRPEDSKTCPYFHQLDALYKEKNKIDCSFSSGNGVKPINPMEPLMVQPEQQWPPQQENQLQTVMEDMENENVDHIQENEEDGDSEEDDGGDGYEIVANKPVSIDTGE